MRIRCKECYSTFRVEVYSEVLEDVHVRGVSDGAHARSEALRVDVRDRLRPHVQHQSIDERDVVADPWLIRYLQRRARLSPTLAQSCVPNRLYLMGKAKASCPA